MNLSKSERISILVGILEKIKNSIKIEAGELNCEIYSDPKIVEAVRKVAGKIDIKVQSSPVICVDEKGHNIIIELWREGKAKLYLRKVRGDKIHRWIGDNCFIFSEDFHQPLASLEDRQVISLTEEQEQYWAIKANEVFDSRIADNEVQEIASEESIIPLYFSDIKKIVNYFSEKGEDYNYKTKDEIETVREQLGIKKANLN